MKTRFQQDAEDLARFFSRLSHVEEALDHYAEKLMEKAAVEKDEKWAAYHNGAANGYRTAAENIRKALYGQTPPLLTPEVAKLYED